MKHDVAILGSGPAGFTAAIYTSRAGLKTTVFAGRVPGGLLTWTGVVENFPGFPDGIEGTDLMMSMQSQAENFGTEVEYDEIKDINFSTDGKHKIVLSNGVEQYFDVVILAMGSEPKKLGIPAEERLRGRGVSNCATCDGSFFKDVPIVVAGGGDSAMEEANYLTRFGSEVHIVHRRNEFRASEHLVKRTKNNPKIKLHLECVVRDIIGADHVEGVVIEHTQTKVVETIPCRGFFCAFGHTPKTDMVKGKLPLDEFGCIVTRCHGSETDIPGVFAAGDCTDPTYRQAVTAAGSGCKAAMDAIRYLENVN